LTAAVPDRHGEPVARINALRTTKGLPAFARWKEAESCVDQQATLRSRS
jgi:hypothetical protein